MGEHHAQAHLKVAVYGSVLTGPLMGVGLFSQLPASQVTVYGTLPMRYTLTVP